MSQFIALFLVKPRDNSRLGTLSVLHEPVFCSYSTT